ncbi:MAG: PDDEXK nuclease domain-containing protein [Bacteroidales bacterium]|nr:PDDEXK nuclease domain-containing protein [Bacteroidales bacterium]
MSEIMKTDLAERIERLITEARKRTVAAVNTAMVYTYYEIGRMIVEDEQQGEQRAEYGKAVIKELAEKLTKKFGKGFSAQNLANMRQFFLTYSVGQPIFQTLSRKSSLPLTKPQNTQILSDKSESENSETLLRNSEKGQVVSDQLHFTLSWSHYLKLMRIENPDERRFYEIEAAENNWSLRELQRQFDSSLYERLALSRDKAGVKALAQKGQMVEKPEDMIKDPYVLEFIGLPELPQYSESELEQRLIDHLQTFLLELGKGFTFVGRQVRFTFDEQHFRVDLVFYNRLLRAFVLIDLKRGTLKHQDLGQMQMYVNYYDRFVKTEDENPTIGILLCTDKSDAMVEITLPKDNNQIFASKYQTYLPSKEELQRLLEENLK